MLLLSLTLTSANGETHFYQPQEVVDDFKSVSNFLQDGFTAPLGCGQIDPQPKAFQKSFFWSSSCDHDKLCAPFKESSAKKYLYLGEDGRKVHNPNIQKLIKLFNQCQEKMADKLIQQSKDQESIEITHQLEMIQQSIQQSCPSSSNCDKKLSATVDKLYDSIFNPTSDSDEIMGLTLTSFEEINPQSPLPQIYTAKELAQRLHQINRQNGIYPFPKGVLEEQAKVISLQSQLDRKNRDSRVDQLKQTLLDSEGLGTDIYSNPHRYIQPFVGIFSFKPTITPEYKEYQQKLNRSYQIYHETKNQIIDLLKSKIVRGKNEAKVQGMIKRIKLLTFNTLNFTLSDLALCPGPNAYYRLKDHSISLCPQVINYPKMTLKNIIAHEIAHSIGPCALGGELREEKREDQHLSFGGFNTNDSFSDLYPIPPEEQHSKHYTVHLDINNNQSDTPSKKMDSATAFKDMLLIEQLNCLQTKKSIGARVPEYDEFIEAVITLEKFQQLPIANVTSMNNSQRERLYQNSKSCPIKGMPTRLEESGADWLATEIIAQDIKKAPTKRKRRMAYESGLLYISMSCQGGGEAYDRVDQLLKKSGCQTLDQYNREQEREQIVLDPHPMAKDRISKILIAHPTIQKAMGCNGKGAYCE